MRMNIDKHLVPFLPFWDVSVVWNIRSRELRTRIVFRDNRVAFRMPARGERLNFSSRFQVLVFKELFQPLLRPEIHRGAIVSGARIGGHDLFNASGNVIICGIDV